MLTVGVVPVHMGPAPAQDVVARVAARAGNPPGRRRRRRLRANPAPSPNR